jgi:hypothetical protein
LRQKQVRRKDGAPGKEVRCSSPVPKCEGPGPPAEPGFDGIRYFSTRVAQYVNDPNPAANYVFPVKVSKPIGFCDQLSKKILLSRPLSWQILQSISFTFKEPIPKVPIWPLKINADVEVPYWQTEFWNCEAKIRSLPCDSVQTV